MAITKVTRNKTVWLQCKGIKVEKAKAPQMAISFSLSLHFKFFEVNFRNSHFVKESQIFISDPKLLE
jgi:hypothetical protein